MRNNIRGYIVIGLFLLSICLPVLAQNQSEGKQNHLNVLEQTSFCSNLYIEGVAGTQMLFPSDAGKLAFEKRLTPAYAITFGKWFSPFWGARLQFQGYSLNVYAPVYEISPYIIYSQFIDYSPILSDVFSRYNLRYFNLHADFQISLANLIGGYDETRRWDLIPTVGLGAFRVFKYKDVFASTSISTNVSLSGVYRLTKAVDLKMEVQSTIVPDFFNGQISHGKYENTLGVMLGVSYRFKPRGHNRINYPKTIIEHRTDTIVKTQKVYIQQSESALAGQALKNLLLSSISFRLKSSIIDRNQEQNLLNAAKFLKQNPKVRLRIIGYADHASVDAESNLLLAQTRAKSVRSYLIDKLGVSSDRMELEAFLDQSQPNENNNNNRMQVVNLIIIM